MSKIVNDAHKAAADKIEHMIGNLREAMEYIDRNLIERWVDDLLINKTFFGFGAQDVILEHMAKRSGLSLKQANTTDESRGIDGYLGSHPVSVKPATYKQKSLGENILAEAKFPSSAERNSPCATHMPQPALSALLIRLGDDAKQSYQVHKLISFRSSLVLDKVLYLLLANIDNQIFTFFKTMEVNTSATFDAYGLDEENNRVNIFNIKNGGGLLRLTSANLSTQYTFNNNTFKKSINKDQEIESTSGGGRNDDLFGMSRDFSDSRQYSEDEDDKETCKEDCWNYDECMDICDEEYDSNYYAALAGTGGCLQPVEL